MPTKLPRVLVTMDHETKRDLDYLAKRENASISSIADEFIQKAIAAGLEEKTLDEIYGSLPPQKPKTFKQEMAELLNVRSNKNN